MCACYIFDYSTKHLSIYKMYTFVCYSYMYLCIFIFVYVRRLYTVVFGGCAKSSKVFQGLFYIIHAARTFNAMFTKFVNLSCCELLGCLINALYIYLSIYIYTIRLYIWRSLCTVHMRMLIYN